MSKYDRGNIVRAVREHTRKRVLLMAQQAETIPKAKKKFAQIKNKQDVTKGLSGLEEAVENLHQAIEEVSQDYAKGLDLLLSDGQQETTEEITNRLENLVQQVRKDAKEAEKRTEKLRAENKDKVEQQVKKVVEKEVKNINRIIKQD